MLGLHSCKRAFSSCGERGYSLVAVCGFLIVVASLVLAHRLSCPRLVGSSWTQGSNLCPLPWQADSLLAGHLGRLGTILL